MTKLSMRKNRIACKQVAISCVVPAFNEKENIESFIFALDAKLKALSAIYEIIIVDDGSQDNTASLVAKLATQYPIKLLVFSRNFGKEQALTAGLAHCTKDVAILIDCDFQHPLEIIDTFLEKWTEGYDMVYGVRHNRTDETVLKRTFTKLFYYLMQSMTKTNMPANAGDFRLMDKKVYTALNTLKERSRFMKGLYAWVGFKSIAVPFIAPERSAGKSSYRFRKLAELAITGITAFSDVPLRVWGFIGLIISALSFTYGLIIVVDTLIFGADVPGYATIVVAIMFFGGIQLLSIGILGEYIARIFNEVKKRPNYIIEEKIGFSEEN